MEGKTCQVSEEGCERCGYILQIFSCRAKAIPSMLDGVVRRLLLKTSKG